MRLPALTRLAVHRVARLAQLPRERVTVIYPDCRWGTEHGRSMAIRDESSLQVAGPIREPRC